MWYPVLPCRCFTITIVHRKNKTFNVTAAEFTAELSGCVSVRVFRGVRLSDGRPADSGGGRSQSCCQDYEEWVDGVTIAHSHLTDTSLCRGSENDLMFYQINTFFKKSNRNSKNKAKAEARKSYFLRDLKQTFWHVFEPQNFSWSFPTSSYFCDFFFFSLVAICTRTEMEDFLREAACMKEFDHPNVMRLLGKTVSLTLMENPLTQEFFLFFHCNSPVFYLLLCMKW